MEILSDRTVKKTRKDHRCHCCSEIVSKGSSMRVQVNVYDGFNVFRWCMTCDELCERFPDEFIDYGESFFPENCVKDVIDEYEQVATPEELLRFLKDKKEYYSSKEAEYQSDIDRELSSQSQY